MIEIQKNCTNTDYGRGNLGWVLGFDLTAIFSMFLFTMHLMHKKTLVKPKVRDQSKTTASRDGLSVSLSIPVQSYWNTFARIRCSRCHYWQLCFDNRNFGPLFGTIFAEKPHIVRVFVHVSEFSVGFCFVIVDRIKVHFVQDKNAVDNLKEASKNCAYIDNIFYVEMSFHIVCFITMIYTICVSVKARNSLYPK